MASGSYDGKVKLWEIKTDDKLKLQQTLNESGGEIYAVSFSPNSEILAIAREDGQIGLFTINTQEKHSFKAHEGGVLSVTFDNSGTRLLSGGRDEYTKLWQLKEGQETKELQSFKSQSSVISVEFSSDDQQIASVGQDLLVHIYQINNKEEKILGKHRKTIIGNSS